MKKFNLRNIMLKASKQRKRQQALPGTGNRIKKKPLQSGNPAGATAEAVDKSKIIIPRPGGMGKI